MKMIGLVLESNLTSFPKNPKEPKESQRMDLTSVPCGLVNMRNLRQLPVATPMKKSKRRPSCPPIGAIWLLGAEAISRDTLGTLVPPLQTCLLSGIFTDILQFARLRHYEPRMYLVRH
jgi:hypothetical protein